MTLTVSLTDPDRGLDVEFSAESGSVTAILGPNGAGKSTVLDAIAGVHSSGGDVILAGRRLTGLRAHRRGKTDGLFDDKGWLQQGRGLSSPG